MQALEELETTEDAGRSLPNYGPDWDAAIAAGVDVTMIEQNLRLTPAERLQQMEEAVCFVLEVQMRTIPEPVRRDRERQRLEEKLAMLGPEQGD
jgi:hypothetical protein